MSSPLLSVVIPTSGRPEFLPLAVRSALTCSPLGDVEVIVVPNGPDTSWKLALESFATEKRLSVHTIETPHANAARSYGLQLSRGKYVRFLDDDDELYSMGARQQLELMDVRGAMVASGSIDLVDQLGNAFKVWKQATTSDFVEAMLSRDRTTHLAAHVFRRSLVEESTWPLDVHFGQDTHWMLNLCLLPDFYWLRMDERTGFWRHHGGPRISASRKAIAHYKASAEFVLGTALDLRRQGRLDSKRADAASRSLWNSIHGAFFMDPRYWARFIVKTTEIFPNTYPDIALYNTDIGRKLPPTLLETAMVPKRWMNHLLRQYKRRKGLIAPW